MTNRMTLTMLLVAGVVALPHSAVEGQGRPRDVLYQVSTLTALSSGEYDGRVPVRDLTAHGDFGLGTFDHLDGEMVVLDGRIYRVRADGVVTVVHPAVTTPFAAVTRFEADDAVRIAGSRSCAAVMTFIEQRLPSRERPYAVKISGTFSQLETRSVRAQEPPYVPLAEALLRDQVVFPLAHVEATLVGFWLPDVLQQVNAARFHFHALTADRTAGGHVLGCEVTLALVEIDDTSEVSVVFAE